MQPYNRFAPLFVAWGYEEITDPHTVGQAEGLLLDIIKTQEPHRIKMIDEASEVLTYRVFDPNTGQLWTKSSPIPDELDLPFACVEATNLIYHAQESIKRRSREERS